MRLRLLIYAKQHFIIKKVISSKVFNAFYFVSLYFLLLPNYLVYELEAGLDPSWRLAIGLAIKKGLTFGRDFIFTYGPLGFLNTKYLIATNKWVIFTFEIFIISSFILGIRSYITKYNYGISYLLFVVLCVCLKNENTIQLIFPCLILHSYLFLEKANKVSYWLCAIISCLSFFIKINYGIISIILFYCITFGAFINHSKYQFKYLLLPILANIGLTLSLAHIYNVDFKGYLISAIHLTDSYNDAMSIPVSDDGNTSLVIAIISIFFILLSGSLAIKKGYKKSSIWASIILSYIYFFLLFKNGFVRADEVHSSEFIRLLPIPFLLLAITSTYFTDLRNILFIASLFVCFIFSYSYDSHPIFSLHYLRQTVTHLEPNEITYDNENSKYKLSPILAASIGKETVDIYPWEIAALYKNNLNYMPRPVIQSYSAYDYYLDSLNAEKLEEGKGPDNILYSNDPIDNRVPFWEESMTKRQILNNYRVVSDFSQLEYAQKSVKKSVIFSEDEFCKQNHAVCLEFKKENLSLKDYFFDGKKAAWYHKNLPETYNYILLKKNRTPSEKAVQRIILEKTIEIGKEIKIPKSDGLIYLYADVTFNWKGKIKRFLFHPDQLMATFLYEDGTQRTFNAIIPILKTGVLANIEVIDNLDAYLFFKYKGTRNKKIKTIRFDGSDNFKEEIRIKLVESI